MVERNLIKQKKHLSKAILELTSYARYLDLDGEREVAGSIDSVVKSLERLRDNFYIKD